MNAMLPSVKPARTYAILKNMTNFMTAVDALIDRPAGTDAFGVMYGEPGLGKSYSTVYASKEVDAILIQVDESFTAKELLVAILTECGIDKPKGTIAALSKMATLQLGDQRRRPLIIDEADKLVDKGLIEYVRGLHDKAGVPVLLVGEEMLGQKLERVPRLHSRITQWIPAQPCDLADCRKLASVFVPNATVAEELLDHVRIECKGKARLVVNTLNKMSDWARNNGLSELGRTNYRGDIFTGKTPKREAVRFEPGVRP